MVRQKLLAEAYFVAVTAAIDAVFAWIESCGAEIRRELGAVGAGEAVELSGPTANVLKLAGHVEQADGLALGLVPVADRLGCRQQGHLTAVLLEKCGRLVR